jgi:hypothetical protein
MYNKMDHLEGGTRAGVKQGIDSLVMPLDNPEALFRGRKKKTTKAKVPQADALGLTYMPGLLSRQKSISGGPRGLQGLSGPVGSILPVRPKQATFKRSRPGPSRPRSRSGRSRSKQASRGLPLRKSSELRRKDAFRSKMDALKKRAMATRPLVAKSHRGFYAV